MSEKELLLIGPLPNPITGVSLANQVICENVGKYSDIKIDSINMSYHKLEGLGKLSLDKILFYSKLYKNIFKIFSADLVYITPGQTFFGVIKYAPFIFLSKITGKKIIAHIHGNHLHLEYKNSSVLKKYIMKAVLSMVDKGIVLSRSLKDNMRPFVAEENIYILENFAEDGLFGKRKEYQLDYLRILYLSNLMPEKGIFDFLDALLILKERNIKFSAQVAGAVDFAHKVKIEEYFGRLGDGVEYLGVVRGDAKRDAFVNSNVFVFPTYYTLEGQPIAILEAMATGNVILTTKHAGIPDIFAEGVNGYYVEKKSPASIAEKLAEVSSNLAGIKNIMLDNQRIAAEKYRVETFIRNFIHILES